ncbi:MAG: carbohydrate kinase family protein [Thermoguttaceae bacterium]|nr:carbohydrate kinase family protein [Thermoguttaceae bacterium]
MSKPKVVCAGHLCLDIIPDLSPVKTVEGESFIIPGHLVRVGAASIALGGAVSNTAIAFARLGMDTVIMGKIGDDLIGKTTLEAFRALGMPNLDYEAGMIQTPGEASSYSIVINPPKVDRCFLHCSGANDTFSPNDLDPKRFEGVRLLHFGYPTLMHAICTAKEEFAARLKEIREMGVLTSLDVTMPDPEGPEGDVDWKRWFETVLPFVDIYLPSLEETLFMLNRPLFDEVTRRLRRAVPSSESSLNPAVYLKFSEIDALAKELLRYGTAAAGIKLGDQGIYLRTAENTDRLTEKMASNIASQWPGRKILAQCYEVPVVGTTGSGDCTIAGFLTGLLNGWAPKKTLRFACAVGACNVQKADATSGVPTLEEVLTRVKKWDMKECLLHPEEVDAEFA